MDLLSLLSEGLKNATAISDVMFASKKETPPPQPTNPNDKYIHAAPESPGITHTLSEVISSPLQALKGPAQTIKKVGRGLWGDFMDEAQAISGKDLTAYGATVPLFKPDSPDSFFDTNKFIAAAEPVANIVTLGGYNSAKRRLHEAYLKTGPQDTIGGNAGNIAGALSYTVWNDILPGQEGYELLTGQKQTGTDDRGAPIYRPITASEVTENISTGLLKLVGAESILHPAERFSNLQQKISRLEPEATRVKKTISSGEIAAAKDMSTITGTPPVVHTSEGLKPVSLKLDDELNAHILNNPPEVVHPVVGDLLTNPELNSVSIEAFRSSIANKVVEDIGKDVLEGGPVPLQNEIIARIVEQGGLEHAAELSQSIVERVGAPPELANQLVADLVRQTATHHGEGLGILSESKNFVEADLLERAQKGDAEAIKTISMMKDLHTQTWEQTKGVWPTYKWAVDKLNTGLERTRRINLVGQVSTAVRNGVGQMVINYPLELLNNAVTGIAETAGQIKRGLPIDINKNFGDLIENSLALMSRFSSEERAGLEQILNALPPTKDRLLNTQTWGGHTPLSTELNLLENMKQGVQPRGALQYAELGAQFGSIANYAQETFSRRVFFQGRLGGNLRAMGKSWNDLTTALENSHTTGELHNDYKVAIADAEEHALKQTFAFTAGGNTPMQVISNLYKVIPGATALLPTFPKFMANQLRWQMERSPTLWIDMMSPKYRDALYAASEGGGTKSGAAFIKQRNAWRQAGRAFEGLALAGAAYAIRSSDAAGPNYWQIATGTKDSNGVPEYRDMRGMQPMGSYLLQAELIKHYQNGTDANIHTKDWLDAVAGLQRLGDVPMLNIGTFLDPDGGTKVEKVQKFLGDYMAGFFVPYQQLQKIYGVGIPGLTSPHPEALIKRDVSDEPGFGPTKQRLPIANETLPISIDAYTGQPIKEEHPIGSLIGLSAKGQTPLQSLFEQTPNVDPYSLGGSHNTAEATNAVRREVGLKLSQVIPSTGKKVGDQLAETIKSLHLNPELQTVIVKDLISELNRDGYKTASQNHPLLFVEQELHKEVPLPTLEKDIIKFLDEKIPRKERTSR